jgi:tetratricopeptide (TPR) repeat protein
VKIADAEKLIETKGLTDELFDEFKKSLKRVPKGSRCQHCYLTAYNLHSTNKSKKNLNDAVRLIEYGIENHTENDFYMRAAYEHLGMVYSALGEYKKAKSSLRHAASIVSDDPTYIPYYAYLIIRMELHCNNFTYTPYLEELYGQMLTADNIEAERRVNIFYRALTEIIIADKNNSKHEKNKAYTKAFEALNLRKPNILDSIFKRHRASHMNAVNATPEALDFLYRNLP